MFGKVYFPRLIMPLSIVLSNLVKFAVQLILLASDFSLLHFIQRLSPGYQHLYFVFTGSNIDDG